MKMDNKSDTISGFTLSDFARSRLIAWEEKHEKATGHLSQYGGAIGGVLTFEFTPTSVGLAVSARCNLCSNKPERLIDGEGRCNLTNYEEW